MGDVYDDLENYEEENIIKELKNENKELKSKLEEYAFALDTLQKDFDKLSAEYKKLELNYSSLLKTARAEIERKTTIITNLNVEKDKLVISALQNRGRGHTNNQNKTPNVANTQQTEIQPVKAVGCDKRKNDPSVINETDKIAVRNDRKDIPDKINCVSTASLKARSGSIEKRLIPKNVKNDKDKDETENKKSNQNHLHDVDGKGKVKVKKIHDRRKSMPLLNRGDMIFSSDEEQEDNPRDHIDRNRFKRKAFSRDLNDRKHYNDHTGRNGPRASDITRVNDKYGSYHNSSRDYRKSNNRHHENDRHRFKDNWDKYDSGQRSRRHYSPHRSRNNTRKEGSDDRPHRSDTVSHRILESPPPDRYHNQYRKSREIDRYRFQNEESMKQKIHDVMEEPACKRMRTESLNRQLNENVNLPPDRDIEFHAPGTQPAQFSYLYLQSPDHVYLENNPPFHQVKEIMGTATTDLEDPRLKSKKYVFKTHKDKVTLSTVLGRDVDMKFVDQTTWEKDEDKLQKMPTPLRERPQMPVDLVRDIYMDIDHPILNLSLESGEIECSEDDIRINNVNKNIGEAHKGVANSGVANPSVANTATVNTGGVVTSIPDTGIVANTGVLNKGVGDKDNAKMANTSIVTTNAVTLNTHVKCNKPVHNIIQSQHQIQDNKKQIIDPIDNMPKSTSFFKKYTIPKVNKPSTHKPLEDVITNIMHKLDKKELCEKNKADKEIKDKEKGIQREMDVHNPLKLFSSAKQICDNKSKDEVVDVRRGKYSPEKATSSVRDTVEGDLELSDETSDCTEFTDQIRYNKEKNVFTGEGTSNVIEIAQKDTHDNEMQGSDCINKQCKDLKYGIEIFDNKHTNAPVILTEVKFQESKTCNDGVKDKSKEMKTKLCDLFGDSSSLITPDDLGIVEPPITNQIINDYVPLFDNTQDALDLNVEEMEKVQTRSLKKEFDKGVINSEHQDAKQDKKQKNKASKTNNEGKKKTENFNEKMSTTEHLIRNDNAEVLSEEPNVVKTIIISTGVQNNCNTEDLVSNNGKESQSLDMLGKVHNNMPNSQPLPNLKALATSTPHKVTQIEPTLSVPQISCNSKNILATKDSGTSSNTEDIGKTTQNNLDVPDVRIIIKRRRKGKANPS